MAPGAKWAKSSQLEIFDFVRHDPIEWLSNFENKFKRDSGEMNSSAFQSLYNLLDSSSQKWHFQFFFGKDLKEIAWHQYRNAFTDNFRKESANLILKLKASFTKEKESLKQYVEDQLKTIDRIFGNSIPNSAKHTFAFSGLPIDLLHKFILR